ncbi:cobyrinate a,c-diamide synthase [Segnochrobactraceae bacterium EtOH-i3]
MTVPGLVIAAPRSGAGKTTVALGLMRAFTRAGVAVAGAKCGPDYIDPAFHAAATGHPGVNLDSWILPPDLLTALATNAGLGAELVLCEGGMGLFDGIAGRPGRAGSTADIAARTGWPVLLVLDVTGQGASAGAVALGCARFDPRLSIAGVILNRVGSPRHTAQAEAAIESVGLSVVGALPRGAEIILPERHLGLVQAGETADLSDRLDRLADFLAAHTDLARIRALAATALPAGPAPEPATLLPPPGQRIAIARDAAFSFVYPHVLAGWRAAGAEILFFSPLADAPPPEDADACFLPGGYPELHAGTLATADRFRHGLARFAATRPVIGECGGYMVLGQALVDAAGTAHPMTGLLSHTTSFQKRRLKLGYRTAETLADGPFGPAGTRLSGHEFHYATVSAPGTDAPLFRLADAHGSPPELAGGVRGRVAGSFFHAVARGM